MGDSLFSPKVPKVLYGLLEQVDTLENLTPEVTWQFVFSLNDDESFLPELVAAIGPDNFLLLVKHLGGQSIRIPKPDDILRRVKKMGDGND